jgi:hypothetical protein
MLVLFAEVNETQPVDGNCIRFQNEQTACCLSKASTGNSGNHELNLFGKFTECRTRSACSR